MNRRTSVLALFSFLAGLAAAACVSTAWFLTYLAGMGDWAALGERDLAAVLLAARIVAGATVAPAVVALAFCLGARGAVREGGGALLGRGLYRAGALLAIVSMIFALGGRWSVNARINRMLADAKLEPRELLRRVTEADRGASGEARSAKAHGRACPEIEAAAEMDSSHSKQAVFDAVAVREELTEHEQMHLVDCVLESLDADYARASTIGKLAGNPWLTEGTRAYVLRHISAIDSDTYRQQAILSLPQKPVESYGYLGVTHQSDGSGARITKVWPESAAAKAGLEVGMTIVRFDGRPVRNQGELNTFIQEHAPGAKVKLALKDGRELEVTLGARPGARKAEATASTIGWFGFDFDHKQRVSAVTLSGPAAKAGLRVGDEITHVDDRPLSNPELRTLLAGSAPGTRMCLRVIRNGEALELTVEAAAPRKVRQEE